MRQSSRRAGQCPCLTAVFYEGGWEGSGTAKFTGMLPDGRLLYEGTGQASGWGELDEWHLQDTVEVDRDTGIKHYTGYVFSTGK